MRLIGTRLDVQVIMLWPGTADDPRRVLDAGFTAVGQHPGDERSDPGRAPAPGGRTRTRARGVLFSVVALQGQRHHTVSCDDGQAATDHYRALRGYDGPRISVTTCWTAAACCA